MSKNNTTTKPTNYIVLDMSEKVFEEIVKALDQSVDYSLLGLVLNSARNTRKEQELA